MNEHPSPTIEKSPPVPTMDVVAPAPQDAPETPLPAQAQKAELEKTTESKNESPTPTVKKSQKPVLAILLALVIASGLIALAVYSQLQKS